jgi:hypothetical protein
MTFSSSKLSLVLALMVILTAPAKVLAADQTVRIFAMDSNTVRADIGCSTQEKCQPWHVYKMKIVAGPEKGRIIYVAERSAKKKPHWKFKNKEILVSDIEDEGLATQLSAEYLIKSS